MGKKLVLNEVNFKNYGYEQNSKKAIDENTRKIAIGFFKGEIPKSELEKTLKTAEQEQEYEVAMSIKSVLAFINSPYYKMLEKERLSK